MAQLTIIDRQDGAHSTSGEITQRPRIEVGARPARELVWNDPEDVIHEE
jgi:hypothetical protein